MTIKEIIQKLYTAITDSRGQESHFESWLTLNDGIIDAIDALKALDKQEPAAWEQFYPDIGKPQIEQPKVRTGDCLLVGVCALEGHKIQKAQPDPVAMKFKIYKPTVPDPLRQDINNALLPWVYDQDRSSGFDATMWVTPVATLPLQRTWVGLTDKEAMQICIDCGCMSEDWLMLLDAIEAKLKDKNT